MAILVLSLSASCMQNFLWVMLGKSLNQGSHMYMQISIS